MNERIACRSCGNLCWPPVGAGTYLCPQCRRPLPAGLSRAAPGGSRCGADRSTRITATFIAATRGSLLAVGLLAAVLLVVRRAVVMPAAESATAAAAVVPVATNPYTPGVERS